MPLWGILNSLNMNYFLFLIAITCLSQSTTWVRLSGAPALMLGFWRLFGACLVMLAIAYWTTLKDKNIKEIFPQNGRKATLLSGAFFFLHLWTYAVAVQNTSVANCMILFAVSPVFTSIGSYLIFKDKLTPRLGFAYIFAALGIYQLVNIHIDFSSNGTFGDTSALASAVFYSGYILSGKRARAHMPNSIFSVGLYSSAAVLFLVTALIKGVPLLGYADVTWYSIGCLILLSTVLGHGLFTYLLNHLDINWMSCGKLIEPVFASLIAYLIFKETLSPNAVTAFAFTAVAVMILFMPWKKKI